MSACHCAETLREANRKLGMEVHVQRCPDIVVVGEYPPFIVTCPHGVRWISEPTGEQISTWVREQTP